VLITAGFILSGFHYYNKRNPDAADNEITTICDLDFYLLFDCLSSEIPEIMVSAK